MGRKALLEPVDCQHLQKHSTPSSFPCLPHLSQFWEMEFLALRCTLQSDPEAGERNKINTINTKGQNSKKLQAPGFYKLQQLTRMFQGLTLPLGSRNVLSENSCSHNSCFRSNKKIIRFLSLQIEPKATGLIL